MRQDKYILDENGKPVEEPDILKWCRWYQDSNEKRIVRRTRIGDVLVSTVFLGLDHGYSPEQPPILWETMIFGGEHDMWMNRYASVEEAIVDHEYACSLVRGEVKEED